MNRGEQDKNILAVVIGIGLIVLVAVITFREPLFGGKTEKETKFSEPSNDSIEEESQADTREVISELGGSEKTVVLDMRTETDFKKEHIIGSLNVPLSNFTAAIPTFDKSKQYVIVSYEVNQEDVEALGNLFRTNGLTRPKFIAGGLEEWKAKYGPTISDGDPNSFTDQSKVNYIKSDKLKELLLGESNFFIIDLRTNSQFKKGHLKAAINIFLDDLEKQAKEIPSGKRIVLYDENGLAAFKGAVRLYDLGFFNVLSLADGINGWKEKGYETVQ